MSLAQPTHPIWQHMGSECTDNQFVRQVGTLVTGLVAPASQVTTEMCIRYVMYMDQHTSSL
jgi:hypothetical protein